MLKRIQNSIQEDEITANDENEDQQVRKRALERISEKREQIDALENEREDLEERLPLRESEEHLPKVWINSNSLSGDPRFLQNQAQDTPF